MRNALLIKDYSNDVVIPFSGGVIEIVRIGAPLRSIVEAFQHAAKVTTAEHMIM